MKVVIALAIFMVLVSTTFGQTGLVKRQYKFDPNVIPDARISSGVINSLGNQPKVFDDSSAPSLSVTEKLTTSVEATATCTKDFPNTFYPLDQYSEWANVNGYSTREVYYGRSLVSHPNLYLTKISGSQGISGVVYRWMNPYKMSGPLPDTFIPNTTAKIRGWFYDIDTIPQQGVPWNEVHELMLFNQYFPFGLAIGQVTGGNSVWCLNEWSIDSTYLSEGENDFVIWVDINRPANAEFFYDFWMLNLDIDLDRPLPITAAHGINSDHKTFDEFVGAYMASGIPFDFGINLSKNTVAEGQKELGDLLHSRVSQVFGGVSLITNLIGHSKGQLKQKTMLAEWNKNNDNLISVPLVISLSSPNLGSHVADYGTGAISAVSPLAYAASGLISGWFGNEVVDLNTADRQAEMNANIPFYHKPFTYSTTSGSTEFVAFSGDADANGNGQLDNGEDAEMPGASTTWQVEGVEISIGTCEWISISGIPYCVRTSPVSKVIRTNDAIVRTTSGFAEGYPLYSSKEVVFGNHVTMKRATILKSIALHLQASAKIKAEIVAGKR